MIIAFIYGWKLTLVILCFVPFLAIAGFLQVKMLTGAAGKNQEALELAGKVLNELHSLEKNLNILKTESALKNTR